MIAEVAGNRSTLMTDSEVIGKEGRLAKGYPEGLIRSELHAPARNQEWQKQQGPRLSVLVPP